MHSNYETLYNQIKKVLEKNIDAQKGDLKASETAKRHDVKLFFKQKAHNRYLFNEKLLFELNYAFDFPKVEGSFTSSLQRVWMNFKDSLIDNSDKSLLTESLKGDIAAINDYEELLKQGMLPLPIRFIIKEQVTVIKLDRLKIEQLINFYK
jgi:uncharacterized protein (TIGR02284 family)